MLDIKEASAAPDFVIADSEGKIVRLSDYLDKKHGVLVFNRGFG